MPFPVEIVAERATGVVRVRWDDEHESSYPVSRLRWACPCATCAGEWGRPGRLAAMSELPPDETILTDVRTVGSYGITPVWASGHATGIYSFEYLRDLCPCAECVAAIEHK